MMLYSQKSGCMLAILSQGLLDWHLCSLSTHLRSLAPSVKAALCLFFAVLFLLASLPVDSITKALIFNPASLI